jgi:hypothetical protein
MAHTTLPENIQRNLQNWRWVDAILRWRTRDVLRRSQIHRYLPKVGLMLDLGSGSGHIAEAIVKEAPGRSCVMMDPVSSISPHVARLASFSALVMKGDGMRSLFPIRPTRRRPSCCTMYVRGRGKFFVRSCALRTDATFVLLEDTPRNAQEAENTARRPAAELSRGSAAPLSLAG